MISWNKVIRYCKHRVSLPSSYIELTDEEIREYLIDTALSEFSTYFPDTERTSVVVSNPAYVVPNRTNQFYFFDDEDLDIINIKECYFDMGLMSYTHHPHMNPLSMEGMKWWSLQVFTSRFFGKFSDGAFTYKFIEPNIVEVNTSDPSNIGNFVVEYEREQPTDLSKVPRALDMMFKDLCLAHLLIRIGGIRSMYGDGQITTPFGTIDIKGAALKQEGEEIRDKIVQQLKEESILPFILDID